MEPQEYNIEDFELGEELGSGGFASVYRAKCIKLGSPWKDVTFAVKKIKKEFIAKNKIENRVRIEKYIHRKVDHPNIVKCYTTFEDKDFHYLVLELCEFTLEDYLKTLKREGKIVEVCAFDIINQIVAGLHYIQYQHIMHRDLSLRNFLVTTDKKIKITDFGLSALLKTQKDEFKSVVGTQKFQSPEMRNHKPYGLASDCWSLGTVIFAILGGESGSYSKDIQIPDHFSPEAIELVTKLLTPNPAHRWSLEDVMESSFFNKYRILQDKGLKKGSSRDSGMDSIGTSFATSVKNSRQSQRQLDSGCNVNDSTKSYKYKASLLSNKHSSESLYQSNRSKTRPKHITKYAKPSLEIATVSNKRVEPSGYRDIKNRYQTLPSRHAYDMMETTSHTGYQNSHVPLHLARNSDKRERSASEEQRKQELQRLQDQKKNSYSGEAGHASHHSRDRSKHSQKKSSEKNSEKYFQPSRSNIHTENSDSQFRLSKYSNHDENLNIKKNLELRKVPQETSTPKKPLPLSTERLKPCRYPMKKFAVVSIVENGEVCVEWLKTKNEKQYVSDIVFISNNGKWIETYKPHNCLVGSTPPPKPNNNKQMTSFSYDDLPTNYFKIYRKAKVLVDFVRATTPRITYYNKDARCVMMDNYPNPDFEMEFFDGGNITQKSNKVTITDERGQTILLTELKRPDKHFAVMWDKFCKMKEWCKNMEAQLEAMKSNGKIEILPYPVIFGDIPLEKKNSSAKDNFKENIVLRSSGQPATSKNKYSLSEKYNSSEKHTKNLSNIEEILLKLKSTPKIIKEEVYAEYEDGHTVICSKNLKIVKIYDSRKKCVYDSRYNDKCDSLIDMILQDLPFFVAVAVSHDMKPNVT